MNKSFRFSKTLFSLSLGALIIASPACRTQPAPDAGFAKNPEKMTRESGIPFQGMWCAPDASKLVEGHNEFIVSPVDTSYLTQQNWWRDLNARGQKAMQEDIDELAKLMQKTFTKEIQKGYKDYPAWTLVTEPGSKTFVIELAVVELIPNKRFWNTAMSAGGFLVPGLGMAGALGGGSTAIEGRVRDGGTNSIICEFKDRRTGKRALVDVQSMRTLYGHSTDAIQGWARETNRIIHVPPGTSVSRTRQFRLLNW